ncbi:hypothetical protein MRX96_013492 [Rhipicephalus microplus]
MTTNMVNRRRFSILSIPHVFKNGTKPLSTTVSDNLKPHRYLLWYCGAYCRPHLAAASEPPDRIGGAFLGFGHISSRNCATVAASIDVNSLFAGLVEEFWHGEDKVIATASVTSLSPD